MNAADIRNYLDRDWRLIEQSKIDFWRTRKAEMTPDEVFALSADLLEYVRSLRPDWPTSAEREEDLQAHIRLARLLDAARHPSR